MNSAVNTGGKLRALSLSVLMVLSVFGGVVALSGTAAAANNVANASIDRPSAGNTPLFFTADDNLQVGYSYEDDDPDQTTIELVENSTSSVAFTTTVDDSDYAADDSTKTVSIPMDAVPDGEYTIRVTVSDDEGDVTRTLDRPIVRDDTPPSSLGATLGSSRVKPAENATVSYGYVEENPESTVVSLEGPAGTATYEFDDSGYAGDGSRLTRALNLSNPDSTTGNGIVDGAFYEVTVKSVDRSGNENGPAAAGVLVVDAEPPTVEFVDAEIGSRTVTVVFSERVEASGGGSLEVTDFTFTDESGGGATAIESVNHGARTSIATVTLDRPLTADDVGTDSVGVRNGVAVDIAARSINATEVTLTDRTTPGPPIVDAAGTTAVDAVLPVTQNNEDSYPIRVIVTEPEDGGTLQAGVEGPDGTVETATTEVQAGKSVYTVTVDAHTLSDGPVTVGAQYVEPSGAFNSRTVGTTKETTHPRVQSAASNANVSEATVTFDEAVFGLTASTVSISGVDANVTSVEHRDGHTYELELDGTVPESAIGSATVEVDTSITDRYGNPGVDTGATATLDRTTVVDATSTDGTVTVTVSATAESSPDATARRVNSVLTSTDRLRFQNGFDTELAPSDFESSTTGGAFVYEATFDAPSDGAYRVSAGELGSDTVAVDQEDPHPLDAVVLDVTAVGSVTQERTTTRIRVRFTEPIDASNIDAEDVEIVGSDREVIEVVPAGSFGAIEFYVDGYVQTGTPPSVRVAPDSYTERSGDRSHGADVGTMLHTTKLHLDEGMNFVSVPAASGDLPLSELDTSAVDVVWAYDAEAGEFVSWDSDAAENDFTALEGGRGYIFAMERSATLDVNVHTLAGVTNGADAAPAPNEVQLHEGYNLVGHYQEDDQRVEAAFASVETGTPFKILAQADGSSALAYESHEAGDFEKLETGEAYWVFVQDDQVYTEAPFGVARAIDLYDLGEDSD